MALDDPAFAAVLKEYNDRLDEENKLLHAPGAAETLDVSEMLIAVGEETARLMHALVVGLNAQVIVELGTSYGYSTLFLADAARTTGGRVFSYDVSADKQSHARERLARAGLADAVEFRLGDAVELLRDQPGPVDFVLMDLWKHLYIPCLERLAPLLSRSGTILADNMIFPPQSHAEARAYQAAVRAIPGMQATLLPIGAGIDIAVRQRFDERPER